MATRGKMNKSRSTHWTIAAKDSKREQPYLMVPPTGRPGTAAWFPAFIAKRQAWNFGDWEHRPDRPPSVDPYARSVGQR
jgi:hypothetical protein